MRGDLSEIAAMLASDMDPMETAAAYIEMAVGAGKGEVKRPGEKRS